MTKQSEILGNDKYIPVLNNGFVGLIDHMGNDDAIVQAARVSYGEGTKTVSEDRGLIRYLLRHKHTTPFEMVEFKFHMKMPIFVARQAIRHRTASVNEYSGRYSVMVDEFYVPELDVIQPQSQTNKQGREGEMSLEDRIKVQQEIIKSNEDCYARYKALLGENGGDYVIDFTDDFEGISREMARGVLNVNNYTEWYWKCDLHNIFHFLKLRMDSHAQYEIRELANAIYSLIKPIVPIAAEAYEDYLFGSENFSRMEMDILRKILNQDRWDQFVAIEDFSFEDYGLTKREAREFMHKFNLN